MILQQWLNNPYFLEKDQFEKRELLKGSLLTDSYCNVDTMVMCFDTEPYCPDKSKQFYSKSTKKGCDLTIGKSYKILEHKKGNIKVLNDSNKNVFVTIHRFIYSVRYERKTKLNQIVKSEEDILNDNIDNKLICVLCGQEWGQKNKFTNICENNNCNGYCTWGYESMKPECFTIDKNGFWVLKQIPKDITEF